MGHLWLKVQRCHHFELVSEERLFLLEVDKELIYVIVKFFGSLRDVLVGHVAKVLDQLDGNPETGGKVKPNTVLADCALDYQPFKKDPSMCD